MLSSFFLSSFFVFAVFVSCTVLKIFWFVGCGASSKWCLVIALSSMYFLCCLNEAWRWGTRVMVAMSTLVFEGFLCVVCCMSLYSTAQSVKLAGLGRVCCHIASMSWFAHYKNPVCERWHANFLSVIFLLPTTAHAETTWYSFVVLSRLAWSISLCTELEMHRLWDLQFIFI